MCNEPNLTYDINVLSKHERSSILLSYVLTVRLHDPHGNGCLFFVALNSFKLYIHALAHYMNVVMVGVG